MRHVGCRPQAAVPVDHLIIALADGPSSDRFSGALPIRRPVEATDGPRVTLHSLFRRREIL